MEHGRGPGAVSRACACAWLLAGCCRLAPAAGAPSLPQWRGELARVAALAEQDAPAAHEQAQRLQAAAGASGADRIRALNLLARTELILANTETAGPLAERALEQARLQGDRVGQAEADMILALNTINQGRMDRLLSATTHAVNILDGVPRPDLMAEAMLLAAMTYNRLGKLDDSVSICVRAMEIARISGVPRALALGHHCMAISFAQSDNNGEALQHYVAMAEAARADGSKLLLGQALSGQGGLVAAAGDLRGGEAQIRQAVQLYREVGGPFYLTGSLYALAGNLSRQGRHDEALRLFDEVVATYRRYPNRIGLWWTLTARGAEYNKLGNSAAAWRDVEYSYRLAKDVGVELYVSNSARQLAALAAQLPGRLRLFAGGGRAGGQDHARQDQRAGDRAGQALRIGKQTARHRCADPQQRQPANRAGTARAAAALAVDGAWRQPGAAGLHRHLHGQAAPLAPPGGTAERRAGGHGAAAHRGAAPADPLPAGVDRHAAVVGLVQGYRQPLPGGQPRRRVDLVARRRCDGGPGRRRYHAGTGRAFSRGRPGSDGHAPGAHGGGATAGRRRHGLGRDLQGAGA
jgi:tetratricopeptide (TPR) repeat protein